MLPFSRFTIMLSILRSIHGCVKCIITQKVFSELPSSCYSLGFRRHSLAFLWSPLGFVLCKIHPKPQGLCILRALGSIYSGSDRKLIFGCLEGDNVNRES